MQERLSNKYHADKYLALIINQTNFLLMFTNHKFQYTNNAMRKYAQIPKIYCFVCNDFLVL